MILPRRRAWLSAATAAVGARILLGAALAQDDSPPASPVPVLPNGEVPWDQALKRDVKNLLGTPAGKVILLLIVLLTLVRVFFALRERGKRAAHAGGRGLLGKFFAHRELETLTKAGRFDEAGELVLTIAASEPGPPADPTRELEAAELFLKAKRFQRAAEIFARKGKGRRAAEAYERAQLPELAAELYEKAGERERAEEQYLKAKNKPAVARMWAAAGDAAKASRYFLELSRPRDAAEQLEKLGDKAGALKHYVEAFQMLSASATPDRVTHGEIRVPGERILGVDTESKELFSRICRLYEETQSWDEYARFLVQQGRTDAAGEIFRKAGDWRKAAELFREQRQWDASARLLDENGQRREALLLFAQGRQERGELEKAAELYLEAGELRIAADNLEKAGKTARAAEIWEKAQDGRRAADLYAKVGDYKRAGALYASDLQWQAAAFCFEQSGETAKLANAWEHAGNHFLAGVSFFTVHDTAHAIASLERVPRDSDDRREAARLLGILFHETNRDREALPLFEEGFGRKIENDDVEAFYYYAQTLESIPAEHGKAISAYNTILKLRPHYRDTEKRLAALKTGHPLPKTSIYKDGQDDAASLFHTTRFVLRKGSEKHRPAQ